MTFFFTCQNPPKPHRTFEVMATGCFVQVIYTKGVTDRPVMVQVTGKPGVFKGETPEGLGGKKGSYLGTTWTHSSNSPEVHLVHLSVHFQSMTLNIKKLLSKHPVLYCSFQQCDVNLLHRLQHVAKWALNVLSEWMETLENWRCPLVTQKCVYVTTKILQKGSESLRHAIIGPMRTLQRCWTTTPPQTSKFLSTRTSCLLSFLSTRSLGFCRVKFLRLQGSACH